MESLNKTGIAITLFVIAMGLIPLNDSLIKLMSDHLSVFQIMCIRAMFSLAILLCIPNVIPAMVSLSAAAWLKLIFRGFCLVFAMLFYFLPLATLSLAEVTAIFFSAPLLISLLSVPLLGEKLGIYRITAVIAGMIGVVIIVQPGSEGFQLAYLMPIGSALSYAAFQLITRYIRNDADVLAMVGVQNVVYLFTGAAGVLCVFLLKPEVPDDPISGFLLRQWSQPSTWDFIYLAFAGLIVLNLSFASTNVYSKVEATYVAPFEYIALPTAIFWGIMIWGDWPELQAWIGISLILSGGIFMIYRENIKDKAIAAAAPMRASTTNSVSFEDKEYEPLPIPF